MELSTNDIPARKSYDGSGNIAVSAGKHFMLGTSPPDNLDLDEVCPAGKQWNVIVHVSIIETDL